MKRREFLKTAGTAALAAAAGRTRAARADLRGSRPNIIIIIADDMGFADLGCYGGEIQTPHLDRLATSGLRFTQFYSCTRCCPTRASLLTGLHPHQTGVGHMTADHRLPGYRGHLQPNCITIADALKLGGYRVYMSGKWHLGAKEGMRPLDHGFERYFGMLIGSNSYFHPKKLMRDREFVEAEEGFYTTDAFTDAGLEFLSTTPAHQPFFLYLAFNAPHWPLHALPEDIEKYEGRYREGWDALREERFARQKELAVVDPSWTLSPRDRAVPAWSSLPRQLQERMAHKMAVYAAMMDRLDQNIGRLLRFLETAGRLDNTLILFLSDNGACHEYTALGLDYFPGSTPLFRRGPIGSPQSYTSYGRGWSNAGNTPFRLHKHWLHEGGISTPLIATWPKVIRPGGQLTAEVGHVVDIMATCLELAGVDYPETFGGEPLTPLEGRSLVPVLEGRSREGHEVLCWEHEGNRAVRRGRWKIVSDYPGSWALFDLETDRPETRNLTREKPELVKELAAIYEEWAKKVGVRPWNPLWALQT